MIFSYSYLLKGLDSNLIFVFHQGNSRISDSQVHPHNIKVHEFHDEIPFRASLSENVLLMTVALNANEL